MRCPECDAVNPPGAVRCKACGEKLPRPRPAEAGPEKKRSEQVQAKPRVPKPAQDAPAPPRRPKPAQHAPAPPQRRPAPRDEDAERARLHRRRQEEEDEDEDEDMDEEDEDEEASVASTLVPYKNPLALISYYVGYIALVVGLGAIVWMVVLFQRAEAGKGAHQDTIDTMRLILKVGLGLGSFLGLVGFGLGISGFLYGRSHRRAKGQAHATTGIVLGVINVIGQIAALVLILQYINSQFNK
ncbi:MAG TPA: zinc ribbon domain-containing protein [Gemmataceae bacterium]|jgi:hypothetical protein|nr:zinc ribbon domain-containing protein [Gemmataceae bacterium]